MFELLALLFAAEHLQTDVEHSYEAHDSWGHNGDDFEGAQFLEIPHQHQRHYSGIDVEESPPEVVVEETHAAHHEAYPALDQQYNQSGQSDVPWHDPAVDEAFPCEGWLIGAEWVAVPCEAHEGQSYQEVECFEDVCDLWSLLFVLIGAARWGFGLFGELWGVEGWFLFD